MTHVVRQDIMYNTGLESETKAYHGTDFIEALMRPLRAHPFYVTTTICNYTRYPFLKDFYSVLLSFDG